MSTILHEQGFNSAWIELQLALWTRTAFAVPTIMRCIWMAGAK